ncbi:hypothetical protein MT068_001371 [Salmonella enterica]|nr:hypothetical protein [Salmonella enterica]
MSISENLKTIINLAKNADGKCVSELSKLEAHAVAFCSEFHPANYTEAGTVKYNKEEKFVTLSPAYISMRRIINSVGDKIVGFKADSYHVFADQELPSFKEGNVKVALELYPEELFIPQKRCEYDHLPRLQRRDAGFPYSKDEVYLGIASVIAQVHLCIEKSIEMPPVLQAAHKQIERDWDQFVKIIGAVKLARLLPAFENAEVFGEGPFGTVDYDALKSPHSYLATFLFMASKGLVLKYRRKE